MPTLAAGAFVLGDLAVAVGVTAHGGDCFAASDCLACR